MPRFGIRKLLTGMFAGLLAIFMIQPAAAQDPMQRPDDTWISLNGEIESVESDEFILNYGTGEISVEMDDGDRDADAYQLLAGDRVNVIGIIDDDFLESTTIEASSVFVEKLGTYFYASPADEEDERSAYDYYMAPVMTSASALQGYVAEVTDDEFTLRTGELRISIDVSDMEYNPLDDEGYQRVDVGDQVWISGEMDIDLFDGREFKAASIIILNNVETVG